MITVIDYGVGNLASVKNAFNSLGFPVKFASSPESVETAEKIVLPGVGAFAPAIDNLRRSGLYGALKVKAEQGCPILGICLGMQLLFSESEENGLHKGMDLVPGKVVRFTGDMKIPHMGWNSLEFDRETHLNKGLENGSFVYFVHSYHCIPEQSSHVTAYTDYGGRIASIIECNNIFGMQFHPEKSQNIGLRLLQNFGKLDYAFSAGN